MVFNIIPSFTGSFVIFELFSYDVVLSINLFLNERVMTRNRFEVFWKPRSQSTDCCIHANLHYLVSCWWSEGSIWQRHRSNVFWYYVRFPRIKHSINESFVEDIWRILDSSLQSFLVFSLFSCFNILLFIWFVIVII